MQFGEIRNEVFHRSSGSGNSQSHYGGDEMVIYNLVSAMMGISVLMYVRYCVRHQGIHLETGGWKTKKESPFHY